MANVDEREAIKRIFWGEKWTKNPPQCVVELGAHRGEDESWIRAAARNPNLRYIMVEPDPENVARIKATGFNNWNRQVYLAAINGWNGPILFHRSLSPDGVRGSGSVLQPTGHLRHFPQIKFDDEVMVPGYTFDSFFRTYINSVIDLLWVDIQGAEAQMIQGGNLALSKTRYLFMEAEPVEMYAGQAPKKELLQMLPSEWTLVQDFGYNVLLRNQNL